MKNLNYEEIIESLETLDDKKRIEVVKKLSQDYDITIPLLWLKVMNKENPRTLLSIIRDLVKKEKPRNVLKKIINESPKNLGNLLKHSDPKVRKNVCSIIGEMGDSVYLDDLYSAYYEEDQLFVKSSYILAIGNCGKTSDGERLKKMLEDLLANEKTCTDKDLLVKNKKHIDEEKVAFTKAINKLCPTVYHEFKGFSTNVPMILTAMNNKLQITLDDIKEKSIDGSIVNEGILISEKDLNKVYTCRTFYELLFPVDKCKDLPLDYNLIACAIMKANIVDFLKQCHQDIPNAPFCYRVEFKTVNFNKERTEFVKNLSKKLDELSNRNLRNNPSSYEVEIRIIENNKLCNVYLKLYSFKDSRFDYRYKNLPTSINPVTAAIAIKSISKWLKPHAKILDPFCGTGTMLIERAKAKDVSSLTGVDIYRPAITSSEINSKLANIEIELFDKDILDFSPSYKFDEIISNMPFESNTEVHDFDTELYSKFVNRISELVKPGGMVFLYTVEKNLLKKNLINNNCLQLIDEIQMESGGLRPNVFVIKVKHSETI